MLCLLFIIAIKICASFLNADQSLFLQTLFFIHFSYFSCPWKKTVVGNFVLILTAWGLDTGAVGYDWLVYLKTCHNFVIIQIVICNTVLGCSLWVLCHASYLCIKVYCCCCSASCLLITLEIYLCRSLSFVSCFTSLLWVAVHFGKLHLCQVQTAKSMWIAIIWQSLPTVHIFLVVLTLPYVFEFSCRGEYFTVMEAEVVI
jgi:hypothetical protein